MNDFELFLGALLAGLSALLFLTSVIAWKRTGSIKIGFVAMALMAFTVKGLYIVFAGISGAGSPENFPLLILDFSVIALLYLSVLKG